MMHVGEECDEMPAGSVIPIQYIGTAYCTAHINRVRYPYILLIIGIFHKASQNRDASISCITLKKLILRFNCDIFKQKYQTYQAV